MIRSKTHIYYALLLSVMCGINDQYINNIQLITYGYCYSALQSDNEHIHGRYRARNKAC